VSYQIGAGGLSRGLNRAAILRLIAVAGPIPRTAIARRLGLSPATVTAITRELLDRGLVHVTERAPSRRGRPALLLELVGGAATSFGVKIAPDHLVGVRVNLDAEVLEQVEQPFDATAPNAVERLIGVLASWLGEINAQPPLLGLGFGVPGVVDGERGEVDSPLLGWSSVPLRGILQERLDLPVVVDNDVNTLAVAERLYGRGHDVDNFVTVTIGRGVGLGIVAGGDIYHGFRGGAGEFGHVAVARDGPLCSCGKRGCLEALIADPALCAQARERGVLEVGDGIEQLRALADGGETEALAIYARAGAVLGRSVATLVNVLSPQLVLLSGEGTQAWPFLVDSFQREFESTMFAPLRGVMAEVDPWDDAKWARGAAALVLRAPFVVSLRGPEHEELIRARLLEPETGAAFG
jgi:predicted NBD/HSP70 family sugar kinase